MSWAMSNLAKWDLVFSCRHCAALLYGRVKFCPYCGEDESVAFGTGPARAPVAFEPEPEFEPEAVAQPMPEPVPEPLTEPEPAIEPEPEPEPELEHTTPDRSEAVSPMAMNSAFRPRQEAPERIESPFAPRAVVEIQGNVDSTVGRFDLAVINWKDELPTYIHVPEPTPAPHPGAGRKRSTIVKLAALTLFLLALVPGTIYFSTQTGTEAQKEFTAKLTQARSTLNGEDFGVAERELGALAAAYPDHPAVRALRDELEQRRQERRQEQAAKREQRRDSALTAAEALGLRDAAAPPAQAPAAAQAPAMAAPAPTVGAAPPKEIECNTALAALALCSTTPASPTERDTPQVKGER